MRTPFYTLARHFFTVSACILTFGCKNEQVLNLEHLVIQPHPTHKGVQIFDANGHLLFDQSQYASPKAVDFFMYNIHHPTWRTDSIDRAIPPEFLHLNYAALMKQNRDSIGIHFVNVFLKKLAIRNTIDFRTKEGQALAKIIFYIEYGTNIEAMGSNFTMATLPKMPFAKNAADDPAVINMDSMLYLYNDGYLTNREFLDLIKDKTLIEQFCNLSNLNGTLLLGVLIRPNKHGKEALNQHEISLYYQFIENQTLQIGKIDMNPYRVRVFE